MKSKTRRQCRLELVQAVGTVTGRKPNVIDYYVDMSLIFPIPSGLVVHQGLEIWLNDPPCPEVRWDPVWTLDTEVQFAVDTSTWLWSSENWVLYSRYEVDKAVEWMVAMGFTIGLDHRKKPDPSWEAP